MVLDTQTNGGTATGVDSEAIYINPSSSSSAMLPQPLRNLQNSKRFRILASKYVPVGGAYTGNDAAGTFVVNNQVRPRVTLSWRGSINVNTSGTTANVSAVTDNSIHIVAYAGSTSLTPTFIGKSRVRFMG